MKAKVRKRSDPNEQLQKCRFYDSCFGRCDWCKTHDYSEACVPMLQQRAQNQAMTIRALQSVLEEVRNEVEDAATKRGGGCEYCSGTFAHYQHTANTRLAINTFGKARTLETECMPCPPYAQCCMKGNPARSAFIINYCPNCGRKLEGENNNE